MKEQASTTQSKCSCYMPSPGNLWNLMHRRAAKGKRGGGRELINSREKENEALGHEAFFWLKNASKPEKFDLILFSFSGMHFNNPFVYVTMTLAKSILSTFSTLGSKITACHT